MIRPERNWLMRSFKNSGFMGSIFSCFGAVARVEDEENVDRRRDSRNGGCGCFHFIKHALANKHESRVRSNENYTKSSLKDLSAKEECGVGSIPCSSDEYENECPICLEEFTLENPIISTQCSHGYHLGCLYEWEQRSNTCPICGKAMVFEEMV